jgi:hypothetical protein
MEALAVTPLRMVGGGVELWQRCLPYLPPGGSSKLIEVMLESGGAFPVALSLQPAPGGTPERLAGDDPRVGTGEAELSSRVGEEMEEPNLMLLPWVKIPSLADADKLAIGAGNVA